LLFKGIFAWPRVLSNGLTKPKASASSLRTAAAQICSRTSPTEIQGSGFKTLKDGQKVTFEVKQGPKGLQASAIKPE